MDIEQLARQTYQDDTLQPPTRVWPALRRRLLRRRAPLALGLAATLLAGLSLPWVLRPKAPATMEENRGENLVAEALIAPQEAISPASIVPATPDEVPASPARVPSEASPSSPAAPPAAPVGEPAAVVPATPAPSPHSLPAIVTEMPAPAECSLPVETPAPAPQMVAAVAAPDSALQSKANPPASPAPAAEQPPILIPNVITPNGDGINDCFILPHLERYLQVEAQIYDSHSRRIYHNLHYDNTFCGQDRPTGSYFYVLRFHLSDGTTVLRRGALVIKPN